MATYVRPSTTEMQFVVHPKYQEEADILACLAYAIASVKAKSIMNKKGQRKKRQPYKSSQLPEGISIAIVFYTNLIPQY